MSHENKNQVKNAETNATKKARASRKSRTPLTTRETLSSLIGSARKILRKDKGLNGDADRLPLLTWVMFLKFLDDLEVAHEEEAALEMGDATSRSSRLRIAGVTGLPKKMA